MIVVFDTDVVVAGMRSPKGASAALLLAALDGQIRICANVGLMVEYEATCLRAEHQLASGLISVQIEQFLDGLAAIVMPIETHFLWRPQLRDPGDEMVLEAAVNGRAEAIVTFNRRDFGHAASKFGVEILLPRDALARLRD